MKVFISYRRADSKGVAGRVFDSLEAVLGPDSVFVDVASIPLGAEYKTHIRKAMSGSAVAVVILGKHWKGHNEHGSRIDDPNDLFRIEIESAFEMGLTVIPLLVDGASMPSAIDLPEGIRKLASLQGLTIGDGVHDFRESMRRLIGQLGLDKKPAPAEMVVGQSPTKAFKWLRSGGPVVVVMVAFATLVVLLWRGCRTVVREGPLVQDETAATKTSAVITLRTLLDIAHLPQAEKDAAIMGLGFNVSSKTDDGLLYERDFGIEQIERRDGGLIRYFTKEQDRHVAIQSEMKPLGLTFREQHASGEGNPFSTFANDSVNVMIGLFADSKLYVTIVDDITTRVEIKPLFTAEEFAGKWGRIASIHEGQYTFKSNGTFSYSESMYGTITGQWYLSGRELTLQYGSHKGQYGIDHTMNHKVEVIQVSSYSWQEISGTLKNESLPDIVLRRVQE